MNYINLILFLSFFSNILTTKSNPSEISSGSNEIDINDDDEEPIEVVQHMLANFLFEMFEVTYNTEYNNGETPEKAINYKFEEIQEDEDWKIKVKMSGAFHNNEKNSDIPLELTLLQFNVASDQDEIDSSQENEFIQLSTVEVNNVDQAYKVYLSCQDNLDVIEKIADVNEGLQVQMDKYIFDTIDKNITTLEDGTTRMSLNVYMLKIDEMGMSESSSVRQDYNYDEESETSEMDIMDQDINPTVALSNVLHKQFDEKLKAVNKLLV